VETTDPRGDRSVSDEEWGPTQEGGGGASARLSGPGLGRRILVVLLALLVLAMTFGLGTAFYASAQIERVPVDGLRPQFLSPVNFLVVGDDDREHLTPEQQQQLTTGREGGGTPDSIMLVSVGWTSTAVLSFPRDLVVTRCDGSAGRINGAYRIGGPDCLVETITDLTGIGIGNYIEINFLGFVDIVDAIGGVELCLDDPIADRDAGIDLPAGCQVLDGPDALGFVRVRKIDDDLGRIGRQQEFMRALATEIAHPSTLFNPPRLVRTAGEIGEALTADSGLGMIDLTRLAMGFQRMAAGASATFTVPNIRRPDGATLAVDQEVAAPLFASFRDGSILREVRGGTLEPADVAVDVLNATGVSGLASSTAEVLSDRGFDVREVGNADPRGESIILYPPGREAEAQVLAREIPVSVAFEETDRVGRVTLVLGQDGSDGLRIGEEDPGE
jgi:LCP family protein required for cell wall assembly